MARRCFVSGKKPMAGHNVSHSKRRTNRRFLPNLQHSSLVSDVLGVPVKLRLTPRAIRTVENSGGLDAWLAKTPNRLLSAEAQKLKRRIAGAAKARAQQQG